MADSFDLGALRLTAGEGRRLTLSTRIAPFELGGDSYGVRPDPIETTLEISRTTGDGYALRLRFSATLTGLCMRCLKDAESQFAVDAREVSLPGGGEELDSPYIERGVLDLSAWARDSLALALPAQLLCAPDCPGLCPDCGFAWADLGPDHQHERAPDPRWAKLSELRFDV